MCDANDHSHKPGVGSGKEASGKQCPKPGLTGESPSIVGSNPTCGTGVPRATFLWDLDVPDPMSASTPESILPHQPEYKEGAWRDYSLEELGHWVHLFAKRAQHRAIPEKVRKDLYDAQNYLNMMQSQLDYLKKTLLQ